MSINFEALRDKMNNGTPFSRDRALKRINQLANDGISGDLYGITQEEADQLKALALEKGLEALPEEAMDRLSNVEEAVNGIIKKEAVPNA